MLQTLIAKLKPYLVPTLIFLMAAGILVAIIGNWNSWASERAEQGLALSEKQIPCSVGNVIS